MKYLMVFAGTCWYIPAYTGIYWYKPACTVLSDTRISLKSASGYNMIQGRTRQDKEMPQSPVPLNETIQGCTRPLYLHVPSGTALFRGTGLLGFSLSCLVLPCTVLYPLADFKEILVSESTVHAGIYQLS
jgi:hypothetical protein